MQLHRIFPLVGLVICLTILGVTQQKAIKRVSIKPVAITSGPDMYKAYCAVCHGLDGKGSGPAAEALKVTPPDLTALARMNGGKYPFDHVASTIQGELHLPAHGSREMPVWGALFWSMSQGHSSQVQLRVTNLNKYIESLQAK